MPYSWVFTAYLCIKCYTYIHLLNLYLYDDSLAKRFIRNSAYLHSMTPMAGFCGRVPGNVLDAFRVEPPAAKTAGSLLDPLLEVDGSERRLKLIYIITNNGSSSGLCCP
ncbi:hypothetical protein BC936DRAFT_148292 [Jimgerdemannia flammicorona]|uniref:Uncharacterized protein n=1 Tax=Jimgerdemannia flammicorona TaxID=994334 RepID=A0A433D3I3_9FUNG|nr:hypothetical protein BC936DRAFT_148292 [Jimgerdemannia flammicorona]